MLKRYSITEARKHLSAIVRKVGKTGRPVIITVRGKPVVELRYGVPLEEHKTPEERHRWMLRTGRIIPARRKRKPGEPLIPVIGRKPGLLKRFLEERD